MNSMKKIVGLVLLMITLQLAFGQKMKPASKAKLNIKGRDISKSDLATLVKIEDTLTLLSEKFSFDSILDKRKKACYAFIPKFVQALKVENSFYYPFDSLENVSRIYPSDSSFRIFTWQLVLPKGQFRYFGFIQMKSSKLKLFPLFDVGDTMTYHSQRVTTNNDWYGALYYNIIEKQVDKQPVYTLFGFEAADVITRRKVVEILTFDKDGKPKFGAPLFHIKKDDNEERYSSYDTLTRFFIEYKYNTSTFLNYDRNLEMIVFDHVAPPTDKAKGATFTYVPDGTYEGFVWQSNRWNWVEKVFTFAINEMDNPPIPQPLFGQPARQPNLEPEKTEPKK
jgi:hypothetical protein